MWFQTQARPIYLYLNQVTCFLEYEPCFLEVVLLNWNGQILSFYLLLGKLGQPSKTINYSLFVDLERINKEKLFKLVNRKQLDSVASNSAIVWSLDEPDLHPLIFRRVNYYMTNLITNVLFCIVVVFCFCFFASQWNTT